MEQLFNYGELLICIGPAFLIIALVFGALIWNSLPDQTKKKNEDEK
ncbi:MAG TPA: hypothetical protein VL501_05435 [Pyrinomonadaceae bacterium]|nr:hypothetical protein [Pyrinomonadaceae bacterium]